MTSRSEERFNARMQRTRDKIDEALTGFDYEPCYLLSDGKYLHPHVECQKCRAIIKAVDMAPFDHWATHHRLRAAFLRWMQQRLSREQAATRDREPSFEVFMEQQRDLSAGGAKPVHSDTTEPREEPHE